MVGILLQGTVNMIARSQTQTGKMGRGPPDKIVKLTESNDPAAVDYRGLPWLFPGVIAQNVADIHIVRGPCLHADFLHSRSLPPWG